MSNKLLGTLSSDKRYTFTGEFAGTSFNSNFEGYYSPYITFTNVKLNGEKLLAERVTIKYGKSFSKLGELKLNEVVQFDAKVIPYCTNYESSLYSGTEEVWDYTLERPTKVRTLSKTKHAVIPTDTKALLGYIIVNSNTVYHTLEEDKDAWSPITYYPKFYREWKSKALVNS